MYTWAVHLNQNGALHEGKVQSCVIEFNFREDSLKNTWAVGPFLGELLEFFCQKEIINAINLPFLMNSYFKEFVRS